ncbi:T9SS type A sorting domain-containing protein, partial [Nonlabens ulvanivorans]|uniref:T9SS type A sorting domain-containing protein n=2 Tax=Nonlabens ulvanivorans TaxID=906888 RepID=UPI003299141B
MKGLILVVMLLFTSFSFSQNIQFSDPDLKAFLLNGAFLSQSDTDGDGIADSLMDLDNDGEISVAEADLVIAIELQDLPSFSIQSISDLSQFINLRDLSFFSFTISNPDLSNLPNLEKLEIYSDNVQNVDLTQLNNLKSLIIEQFNSSQLLNLVFGNNLMLEELDIEKVALSGLSLSNLNSLSKIIIKDYTVTNQLTINNNPLLNEIELQNSITQLPLVITNNDNLDNLLINDIQSNVISLDNNNSLSNLSNNGTWTVQNCTNLSQLNFNNNFVSSLRIIDLALIGILNLGTSNSSNLYIKNVNSSQIQLSKPNQGIFGYYEIRENNNLTNINYTPNEQYSSLKISLCSSLVNLDLTDMYLDRLNLFSNQNLETIFSKNIQPTVSLGNIDASNTNLLYICVEESRILEWRNRLDPNMQGVFSNVVINSYCSFTPGGTFNEIHGEVSIDINNNGCDPTDPVFSNFNFNATDGTTTGIISSNQLGEYYAPVADGQHTITPNPENPSYWNISPPNVVVDFPTQASPFTQDFCVTANGTVEDLEVVVVPLEQARPGFDTDYKVVVKNKGNVTSSGSVTLDFEEDFMTLLSTNPNAGNTPSNQLSWSFSNLQPFQMEEYEFTMTLNTPTATINPLNGGDMLTFTGTVTGTGTDVMPADNVMVFDQTVVNSYDPNDKTCLEGETIDPADVGEYVHYMIRFENTGTASAVNIVVKDEIDLTQFDISTLIPLGGSHDYYTRIREGNVVEFIHEDINLDFNDATNDGYVLFKIKTLNTLVAGDTFDNTAEIFFDFNFPIITNTETVTVMSTASVGESTDSSIKVYPNPAKSFINLSASNSLESVTIMDINGRTLSQTNFTGNSTDQRVSLENLSSGIYFVTIQS